MGVQQGKDEVRTMDKYVGNQSCHHHPHLDYQHDHNDHIHKKYVELQKYQNLVSEQL